MDPSERHNMPGSAGKSSRLSGSSPKRESTASPGLQQRLAPNDGTESSDQATPDDIPEEAQAEEKVTLAASVVLTALPLDATGALDLYAKQPEHKVGIKFRSIGSAPMLRQNTARINAGQRFEVVVRFLRKQLKCRETDPLFVYVNSTFAPSLDQEVGYLYECFKIDGHLHVSYCNTAAFG
ncbi:ubiquitin-like protein ATG12 [Dipodascopsis uninucleata]